LTKFAERRKQKHEWVSDLQSAVFHNFRTAAYYPERPCAEAKNKIDPAEDGGETQTAGEWWTDNYALKIDWRKVGVSIEPPRRKTWPELRMKLQQQNSRPARLRPKLGTAISRNALDHEDDRSAVSPNSLDLATRKWRIVPAHAGRQNWSQAEL